MTARAAVLPRPPSGGALLALRPALFLDVDGTLLEFEAHPDDVRATADLVALLQGTERLLDGALAVISGRRLTDLDRVFAPWRPVAAGVHGLELRQDSPDPLAPPSAPVSDDLRRQVNALAQHTGGCWVEDKGATVALHYRGDPSAGPLLRTALTRLAKNSGVELLDGVLVFELRPAGRDKGTAVTAFAAARPFLGRTPVVVGDDVTDEDAFRVALRLGGLAVLVGDREPSLATHRLDDPAAVRRWLRTLPEPAEEVG